MSRREEEHSASVQCDVCKKRAEALYKEEKHSEFREY